MTSGSCVIDYSYLEYFARLFGKLYEDVFEAYSRTPQHISSRPHMERALHLVQSGLSAAQQLLAMCREAQGREKAPS
ncbi:hypothetical protein CF15_02590 [Pyrodictium occultum]|uniref:Uncharacterized protein n=1 Tax=Pyrodictium occultum TaxID=2309 RepID=A0A0V8RUU0_PYROC|nr:hypothetical protein [Pyrodictium occultum]KSW11722.1 hypothetical protein CF15_02590 [Pyrodictium occultum]